MLKLKNQPNVQSAVKTITAATIHAGAVKRFFQVEFLI